MVTSHADYICPCIIQSLRNDVNLDYPLNEEIAEMFITDPECVKEKGKSPDNNLLIARQLDF